MSSVTEKEPAARPEVVIRAEGILYSLELLHPSDEALDWLDRVLLEVIAEHPATVVELLHALRDLPQRFVEDALWRLLRRNRILLDVHAGTVRASDLPPPFMERTPEITQVWQDYATGMVLPMEFVRQWRLEPPGRFPERSLAGGPPERTVLEMSGAELIYRLHRFRSFEPGIEVRSQQKVCRMALWVSAVEREDGRLAVTDGVDWRLRATWARLPGFLTREEGSQKAITEGGLHLLTGRPADRYLPQRWSAIVGDWVQTVGDAIDKRSRGQDGGFWFTPLFRARGSVDLSREGPAAARRLAREAREMVVVVLSGAGGTLGEAKDLLKQAGGRAKKVLIAGEIDSAMARKVEADDLDVRCLPGFRPELVLVDGTTAVFGGISRQSETPFVIRARGILEGLAAWLRQSAGVEVFLHPPPDSVLAEGLLEGLKALEADVRRPRDEESRASVAPSLWTRLRDLQTKLLLESSVPMFWMPLEEVLSLVESWEGPQPRIVACRHGQDAEVHGVGPLMQVGLARGAECVTWPDPTPVADLVLAGEIVLVGSSPVVGGPGPDFLAIRDPELAGMLRAYTSSFPTYAPG